MKIAAVICELNPMHKGHEYIFRKAREIASAACEEGEASCVAAIMSGNFTQRSEPGIYDKYTRARAAVECGAADIVLELPMPWCSSSAEFFAAAGVKIAFDINADFLVFGSECGNPELLRKSAEAIDSPEYKELYKNMESENKSLGAAAIKERVLTKLIGQTALTTPNDILGIEYIRAARRYVSGPVCVPVKRTEGASVKSASALREMIKKNGSIDTPEIRGYMNSKVISALRSTEITQTGPIDYNKFGDTLFRYIRLADLNLYNNTAESGGGLFERMMNSVEVATSYENFIQLNKTKKYTDSRIRRLQLFATCGVCSEDLLRMPKFTFLLASNGVGVDIIKLSKSVDAVKIVTKPSSVKNLGPASERQISINAIADNLYTLCMPKERETGYFMRATPYIKRCESRI